MLLQDSPTTRDYLVQNTNSAELRKPDLESSLWFWAGRAASREGCLKCRLSVSIPDPLNQNLHFNTIPQVTDVHIESLRSTELGNVSLNGIVQMWEGSLLRLFRHASPTGSPRTTLFLTLSSCFLLISQAPCPPIPTRGM